jgi:hypothetical protein
VIWWAVEHELGDIIFHPEGLGVISRQECGSDKNDIWSITHPPMVRFIQLYRYVPLPIPAHHFLVLEDRSFQVPRSAAIHLIEPKKRDRSPGDIDRFDVHFREP